MKIGDQRVNRFETVAGIDENARLPADRVDDAVGRRRALEHTAGGSPDGNDPAAGGIQRQRGGKN